MPHCNGAIRENLHSPRELLDLMQRRGGPKNELLYPPQRDAVVWGMKQPKSALPALERMSKEAVRTNQASLEKTGQMDMAAQAREFWYNGAIQGLREEGGAGGNVAQVKAETLAKMRPTTGIAETTPLAASIGPGAASPADSASKDIHVREPAGECNHSNAIQGRFPAKQVCHGKV